MEVVENRADERIADEVVCGEFDGGADEGGFKATSDAALRCREGFAEETSV
jgi:hypothetical protein